MMNNIFHFINKYLFIYLYLSKRKSLINIILYYDKNKNLNLFKI